MIRYFLKDQFTQEASMPKDIKIDNRRLVLSHIDHEHAFSAVDISVRSGLSKTTLSKMFAEFCESGLIYHVGKGPSTADGGKKPNLFRINTGYRYALVIQLAEPEYISCAIINLACEITCCVTESTDSKISYPEAIQVVKRLVGQLIEKSGVTSELICGIAVSCDGIVDTKNNVILRPAHHKWPSNLPVGDDVKNAIGFYAPISIDNVCRYGGYAELLFPENHQYSNMIVIWNDDFVGGCVLSNHTLVQGYGGLVGEVGHMIVDPDSQIRCSCGGYGCFEPLVAENRLLKSAYERYMDHPQSPLHDKIASQSLALSDIFTAANNGDAFAQSLLDKVTGYYAVLIRNITNLRDVQKVIIQGSYSNAGEYFYHSLFEHLERYPLQKMIPELIITGSKYSDKSNRMIGAGFHAISKFLNSEDYYNS